MNQSSNTINEGKSRFAILLVMVALLRLRQGVLCEVRSFFQKSVPKKILFHKFLFLLFRGRGLAGKMNFSYSEKKRAMVTNLPECEICFTNSAHLGHRHCSLCLCWDCYYRWVAVHDARRDPRAFETSATCPACRRGPLNPSSIYQFVIVSNYFHVK